MAARFDHLVVAVEDLDEAMARWADAGIGAVRGGRHPAGTENALVRGPGAAYVELIAAGDDESDPWLDRIRAARGPVSWAIAVDDIEAARATLVAAGFDPEPAVPGSRRTAGGELVEWRSCDVGTGPYDGSLPFLIEWTTPMAPGPAHGPVVESLGLAPDDPDRVADLLLALGFVGNPHWPRRVFRDPSGAVAITLTPLGDPEDLGQASWSMSWDDAEEPPTSLGLAVASSESARRTLDGVVTYTRPDRRRFAASALLPAVDAAFARRRGNLADWPDPHPHGGAPLEEEYSRCLDPAKYQLLVARADAWVEAITSAGLGSAEACEPSSVEWRDEHHLVPTRVTLVRGRSGTQPLVVGIARPSGEDQQFVEVGIGEPVELLDRQPDCGCDACDTGSADLLETVDNAFVLALSGGVYVVRDRGRVVKRSLDGWSAQGGFGGGEPGEWLAEAADGRRTEGVVRGDAWL